MTYLFIGQDSGAKEAQLKLLKKEYLPKDLEQFNLDILYAKDLNLKNLQEKFLCLPVKSRKRLIVIKDAQDLKEEAREFVINYVRKPAVGIVLVLDVYQFDKKDGFINSLSRHVKIRRFKEELKIDTFTLSRQIEMGRADYALRMLSQLLKNGERPERILGGLRYAWEKGATGALGSKRKLRLLLNCDIDIKTGRLKPAFALEKLVIGLCSLSKPFH